MGERTPKDALRDACYKALWWGAQRREANKPGAVIESLPEEDRQLLKELSPEDFQTMWRGIILEEPFFGSPAWKAKEFKYTLQAILEGRYK